MGTLTKGILGGFQGTVGTVVGGTWKGINYIKSLPVVSNSDPSPKQLIQREKFRTVINFLKPMIAFVQLAFDKVSGQATGYNSAMAYNYRNALQGTYPNFSINYSYAAVSDGSLPNVLAPTATPQSNSIIKFDWTNNSEVGSADGNDKVMLVVYCPELNQAIFNTNAALRSAETSTVNARQFAGKDVQTWVACMAYDDSNVARSIYTGQVTVS